MDRNLITRLFRSFEDIAHPQQGRSGAVRRPHDAADEAASRSAAWPFARRFPADHHHQGQGLRQRDHHPQHQGARPWQRASDQGEHVENNAEVRKVLGRRGSSPEQLPAAEDVKQVERRLAAAAKRLPQVGRPAKRRRGRRVSDQ
jgi:hypothetical protein